MSATLLYLIFEREKKEIQEKPNQKEIIFYYRFV